MENVLLVIEDFLLVKGLTKSYAPLIKELFKALNQEDVIVINASLKREIGKKINSTVRSIENMMTKLLDAEIIFRIDRGRYGLCKSLKVLKGKNNRNIVLTIEYKNEMKKIIVKTGGK